MSIRIPALAAYAVIALVPAAPVARAEQAQAFTNARILPVTGATIEKGTLVVQDGKIVAVGASGQVSVPAGATTVDLAGKTLGGVLAALGLLYWFEVRHKFRGPEWAREQRAANGDL